MNTSYTPKEYILNVLNQCLVSLQEADDFEIMKPEIIKAARLVQNITEKPKQEFDSESWQYFHDRVNNKRIVVNTFSYEKSEPQVNVFVVSNPSSSSWHDDMVQIGSCNCKNESEKPKQDRPDTPDIDSIAETNYENRRT